MSHCYNSDGSRSTITAIGGKGTLEEDELTMALALRLHAALKRMGFVSELVRDGEYGTEGDCAQKALFRKSPLVNAPNSSQLFCDSRYLAVRGRGDLYKIGEVRRLCANDSQCVSDVFLPRVKRAISRAGQIVRDHAVALGIRYDPEGDNIVHSPKVTYIALHFNAPPSAGPGAGTMLAMFSGTVRNPSGNKKYGPNPALTFQNGSGKLLSSVKKNFVTSVFEYMFLSLHEKSLAKPKSVLPEAENKRTLVYQYVDLVNSHSVNARPPGGFTADSREGPLKDVRVPAKSDPNKKVPISFNINPPGTGSTGPVTVVSGLGSHGESYDAKERIIVIPNNVTLEVAHYLDCENVGPLIRSMLRKNDTNFKAPTTPLDPTDPIDVAAEDIAHGLVEYYESYVPGFKLEACKNLKNSDWKDHMPSWCPGGGAKAPDIDGENLTPSTVELPVGDSASATLSFRNVGGSDLNYSVSSSDPVVSLGPPSVVPAGVNDPYATSQSGTLPPNTAANIPVEINCTTAGNHSGEVAIQSNDPYEPQVSLSFTVRCIAPKIGVDEPPAYQTAFNYIAPAGESRPLLKPPFDFYEAGGKAKLEFELEEPEWLHLPVTQGALDPGARFSELLGNNYGEVTCGAVGEQEGYVIVRSNDPDNPEVQIPVRLMCPELEVVFNPDTYDDNLGLLSGVITVHGADHLKEMYARVVSDGSGGQTLRYTEPRFVYKAKLIGYLAYRWPVLHAAGDEYSPWDWSTFPEIPFVSWVNSWAFDDGAHQIDEFSLYRPGAFEEGDSLPPNYVAHLASPAEYTITMTAPWGYAVNSSGYTERVNSYGRFQFYLHPGEKKRLNSELMTFDWDVYYYDGDGHEVHSAQVTAFSPMIGLGTRFLCRFSIVADVDAATAPYVPDARPPDFWQLNIPYAGPKYHVAARWCYRSYSVGRSPEEGAPWWTGEEPEIVPAHDGY